MKTGVSTLAWGRSMSPALALVVEHFARVVNFRAAIGNCNMGTIFTAKYRLIKEGKDRRWTLINLPGAYKIKYFTKFYTLLAWANLEMFDKVLPSNKVFHALNSL